MSRAFVDAFARHHREVLLPAFNRGDLNEAFANLAPDVEWQLLPSMLETGLLRGREQVIRFFSGVLDAVDWSVESQEFTDLGQRRVLVHQRGWGVGRTTRISGGLDFFQIWELAEDGTPVRVREFETQERLGSRRAFGVGDVAAEITGIPAEQRRHRGVSEACDLAQAVG